jgi:hypothetical protein
MISDGCLYFHKHFPMAIKILKFIFSFSFLGGFFANAFHIKIIEFVTLNFELENKRLES